MLGWLAVEKIRDGYATSLGASSGLVAGLVAITPAAGALTPMTSILLGAGGGILSCFGVSLKYRFNYDDSLDVVGVHLVAAVWGTIGLAFFAQGNGVFTGGGADGWKLFAVQTVVAIAAMFFLWCVDVSHRNRREAHHGVACHAGAGIRWCGLLRSP